MQYVEQNCTIKHEGREFAAGGAVVTPDFIIGYVGKPVPGAARRDLTDWHGNKIGTCYISSTWKTPHSYVSDVMHQIYARVDGVDYTGRGAGEGMIFKGRRVKS